MHSEQSNQLSKFTSFHRSSHIRFFRKVSRVTLSRLLRVSALFLRLFLWERKYDQIFQHQKQRCASWSPSTKNMWPTGTWKTFSPYFLTSSSIMPEQSMLATTEPLLSFHYVSDEEYGALLSHDNFACVINDNGSVTIAVKRYSKVCFLRYNLLAQNGQGFWFRSKISVRERWVGPIKQKSGFDTNFFSILGTIGMLPRFRNQRPRLFFVVLTYSVYAIIYVVMLLFIFQRRRD